MNIRLILPKNAVYVEPHETVFFLAGPILGGDDWQSVAVRLLAEQAPESYVACPLRAEQSDVLFDTAAMFFDKHPEARYIVVVVTKRGVAKNSPERARVTDWLE